MARRVEDLALLFGVIAGPDARDTEVQPVPVGDVPIPPLNQLRIAFAQTFPGFPVAVDVRDTINELAQQLDRSGAKVAKTTLPELDFHQELAGAGQLIGMMIGAFQQEGRGQPATLPHYLEALHRRDQSIVAWEQFFQAWDALICPASMITAFPHCEPSTPLRVDGQDVNYWMVSAHGTIFNYTGHPAVVVPFKVDRDGLPIGVQLVGKRWNESGLLAIAKALSPVTGEFRRPPGY